MTMTCWKYDLLNGRIERVCKGYTNTQVLRGETAKTRVCDISREEAAQGGSKLCALARTGIFKTSTSPRVPGRREIEN